jgi:hypothetical protein
MTGRLRVLALPFGRILSLEDPHGRPVPLPKGVTTPFLLAGLEPGTYRVVLGAPAGDRRVERRVEVGAGTSALVSEPFETPSSLAQVLRSGSAKP